ncbi:lysylphosphatidylglycerol synthase transmembrane domain-containing protein [Nocardioides sp.]|uniref:lysylphosphatidylglycerol synthase transmembrane domain-containing protein n=1 Tax=Nocardioides sp. TaxID=35761 RepID=UPI003D0E135F
MTTWDWVRKVGLVALTVVLVEYLAVPQLLKARSELSLFADASVWLLLVAFALEAGSLLAYTSLTQAVLRPGARLPFFTQFRIDLTGLGASHVLPGGGASAAALRYRLMTTHGVATGDALSTAAVQSAIAITGLVATFTGGVALALPGIVSHPGYLLAGLGGLAVLLAVGLTTRAGARASWASAPPRVRRFEGAAPWRGSRWLLGQVNRTLAAGRTVLLRAVSLLQQQPGPRLALLGWAGANWLLDAASLWVCLWAYGVTVHPGALLTAYGAANLIGLLPLTPGGLGVIEGVLIPSLIALGAQGGPVVLGVLTWRALEFWLPIPVAGVTYLSLRLRHRRSPAPSPSG